MEFFDYIDSKPLYYAEIDYERMPRVYEKIKDYFPQQTVIHIIGTNGKGTTGRFLASALYNQGKSVGHYTSPHILRFNERIWKNGNDVSDEIIEWAHKKLQTILSHEDASSLSYFEYTTFLAMLIFNDCEYVVLEAGLGGEHDATAVFKKSLTLVTPIGFDHEAFLGSTIKEIAQTKLNAVQNNAILAAQKYEEVFEVAKELKKNKNIYGIDEFITKEDEKNIALVAEELSLVAYLQDNLKLAIAALKFFQIDYRLADFKDSKLFGRVTQLAENIILDVGHNVLAATSLVNALQGQQFVLVYNTYSDKDYENILEILRPIIKHIEIIKIDDDRIESSNALQKTLNDIEIEYRDYKEIHKDEKYLIFGSFKVIEEFLKGYRE